MRLSALAIVAIAAAFAAFPARAQTYSPDYPVCLHVYGKVSYIECAYTSMAQCNLSASGRGAQCVVNPYFAYAAPPDGGYPYSYAPHHRHHHRMHRES